MTDHDCPCGGYGHCVTCQGWGCPDCSGTGVCDCGAADEEGDEP